MYIPLTIKTTDATSPDIYTRLDSEVTERINTVIDMHNALHQGQTFDGLDPELIDEIKNLDLTQVKVQLARNDTGNLWLQIWSDSQ